MYTHRKPKTVHLLNVLLGLDSCRLQTLCCGQANEEGKLLKTSKRDILSHLCDIQVDSSAFRIIHDVPEVQPQDLG